MLVQIISIMLENTFTTDEVMERVAHMRVFYGKRLFAGGDDVALAEALGGACDVYTIKVLEEWEKRFAEAGIQPLVVYEALDAIEEDVKGLPSVTMYVPIRFSPEHVKRFGLWFREHVQPNILLTLKTDPRVGGGCAFIWNDTYYDMSLRYYMAKQREKIVGMFNAYTHA